MRKLLAVCLLLMVPAVSGGFTPSSDVRNYELHVFEGDSTTSNGVVSGSFNFTTPHDFEVLDRLSWFRIHANYELEGSGLGGVREREFTFQTTNGHDCSWRIRIGSSLQALNAYRAVECVNGPLLDGSHTFWINSTAISGGEPVVWTGYSIILEQHDEVDMSTEFEALTGVTGVEFLAVVGVAAGLLLLGAGSRNVAVKAMASWLVILLAALLLFFNQSPVIVLLAVALGLGAGVVLLLLALERLKREPERRRFFE